MRYNTKRTLDILHEIAKHLSGRDGCRRINYEVVITNTTINITPEIEVFPNTFKRKQSDKTGIIEHIFRFHHSDILTSDSVFNSSGGYNIKGHYLIPGTYVYKSSIDGKRRKWFRT